jgi:hypothetical protein
MKGIGLCILFFLASLEAHAQFSLGGDLIGMGLSRSTQHEDVLNLDSSLAFTRFVFSANSNLVGAYKVKRWEFSLGVGHENYIWKQKFGAPTEEVKALFGLEAQPDTSDILRRVSYSSKLITLPVGVKYFFESKPDSWISAFFSLRLAPTFAYQQKVNPVFWNTTSFLFFPFAVEENPTLVEATRAYFKARTNTFLLDSKAEAGIRVWGNRRKYAVDFSVGYLYGFIPLNEQMSSTQGIFGNLALRFFFKNIRPEKH